MIFLLLLYNFQLSSAFLTEGSLQLTEDLQRVILNSTGYQLPNWLDLLDVQKYKEENNGNLKLVSKQCLTDIDTYRGGLNYNNPADLKPWALKMYDATGKIPAPGIFKGSMTSLPGNIGSCLEVDNGQFLGRYFLGRLYKPESRHEDLLRMSPSERYLAVTVGPDSNAAIQALYNALTDGGSTVGVCLPNSCDRNDVSHYLSAQLISTINKRFFVMDLQDINSTVSWTNGDYAALGICMTLLACILVGTLIDISLRHGVGEVIPPSAAIIFQGFSVYSVLKKIFHVGPNAEGLASINGIRFWSMVWVIVGHTYLSLIAFGPFTSNPAAFADLFMSKSMRLIFNATTSVDSFFMIGGCLLSYLTLKEVTKQKGGSVKFWIMYYVHRYIRLTGAYAGIIMLSATLVKFLPRGAHNFWDTEPCSEDWYTNILYYNNYQKDTCLGQTWYLAVEMQCFLITPVIILLMYWVPVLGNIFTGLLVIASTTIRWWGMEPTWDDPMYDSMNKVYVKPWYRFCSYGVGLILGQILFSQKGKQLKDGLLTKLIILAGWIISLTTILLIVYANDPQATTQTKSEYLAYQTLFRTSWSIALAWIVFATAKGYGGPIGSFLEWSAHAPLAKMTYSAYLVHFLVLAFFNTQINYNMQLSQALIVFICITNVIVSMATGLATVLVFEAPVMHLEKLLFGYLGVSKLPKVNKYKSE